LKNSYFVYIYLCVNDVYFELLVYAFICLCGVFVFTTMFVLYTGAGNVVDGIVEDVLK